MRSKRGTSKHNRRAMARAQAQTYYVGWATYCCGAHQHGSWCRTYGAVHAQGDHSGVRVIKSRTYGSVDAADAAARRLTERAHGAWYDFLNA